MDEEQEKLLLYYPDVDHICEENIVYYEFIGDDNHRYHGYECGICGDILQTG
jgi:hypothetical protein|tara:strand:- start:17 stop:172 length:156 start_codon:yes stop_codon:yes gene_type:complete